MFFSAVGPPNVKNGFNGALLFKPVAAMHQAMRGSRFHGRNEVYLKPCEMNGDLYVEFMQDTIKACVELQVRLE